MDTRERSMTPAQEVRRFLKTGDYDMLCRAWPGCDVVEQMQEGHRMLEDALIVEVRRRAKGRHFLSLPPGFDAAGFVLGKVGPMVRGLFPSKEQRIMLDLFKKSLVFVTHDNIEQIITQINWMSTAWQIANLYLGSLDLPGLDGKPVRFVGLSEETTFFVSMSYFEEENPFADYVLHEAAHVFHNWKRDRAGLRHTREREFLLQIAFRKRELFAFACEAYSRIVDQAKSPADRQRLCADYAARWIPDCDGLDRSELVDILAEAVAARNGWKRILQRCSPPQHPHKPSPSSAGRDIGSLMTLGTNDSSCFCSTGNLPFI